MFLNYNPAREGNEYFNATLFTTDPGVHLHTPVTMVVITDDDDSKCNCGTTITYTTVHFLLVPSVAFTQSEYHVEEPLSNYPVDQKWVTLTVNRSGDIGLPVAVVLSTKPGTARKGVDYTALNTVLQFPAGVNRVNITVHVLANHNRRQDSTFTAFLSVNTTTSSEVQLGDRREANITIRQRVLKGVYFPALPLVASQQYPYSSTSNLTFGTLLFHDNPLLCIIVRYRLIPLLEACLYSYVCYVITLFFPSY